MRMILKLNKKVLVVLMGLSLITISCEKEDENDNNEEQIIENSFTYDGTEYPTPNAIVVNAGETEDGETEFELFFYSSAVGYEIDEGEVYFSSGVGELVSLYLTANMLSENLPEGDYAYVGDGNLLDMAEIEINTDFGSDDDTGIYLEELNGQVKVTKDEKEYHIEYTLLLTNSKTLQGQYKGVIKQESNQ